MSPLFLHISLFGLLHILFCCAAYAWGGTQGALYAWALGCTMWLLWHFYRMAQFGRMLERSIDQEQPAPPPYDLWGRLFYRIIQRERLHHRKRRRLHRTVQRFQSAAESMPEGIVLLNKNGKIDWFNHLAAQHFSFSPEHVLGSPLHKHIQHPNCRAFLQAASDGSPQEMRFSLRQDNGLLRHLRLIRIGFTRNTELIISEDISRAEQLQASRTAFVANVSHELRTPLTVIHGFLETLAEHPNLPPEQQQQFIRLMQHDCARMRHLVDDLMTLTTLEDPQQQNAPKAACNLSRMAEQIVQDTRHLSAGRHTVAADIAPDIWVAGRESELYQALSNLAFNAVRHNPEPCAVHITLRQVDNPNPYKMPLAEFSVRDEGKGIAAEHLPYLTDRFYRVDAGRSRENGGTGLGLAIAKHALANHQASLHIESSLHHGSQFTAQIPTIAPDSP